MRFSSLFRKGLLASVCAAVSLSSASAASLKIGYSDWPGWVAWQVAIDKGWLKEAQVDADFQWFDYSASLDAFAAHKLDAVMATNGDALVTGANGHKGEMILVTDYSDGNDMVVAQPVLRTCRASRVNPLRWKKGWWTTCSCSRGWKNRA